MRALSSIPFKQVIVQTDEIGPLHVALAIKRQDERLHGRLVGPRPPHLRRPGQADLARHAHVGNDTAVTHNGGLDEDGQAEGGRVICGPFAKAPAFSAMRRLTAKGPSAARGGEAGSGSRRAAEW